MYSKNRHAGKPKDPHQHRAWLPSPLFTGKRRQSSRSALNELLLPLPAPWAPAAPQSLCSLSSNPFPVLAALARMAQLIHAHWSTDVEEWFSQFLQLSRKYPQWLGAPAKYPQATSTARPIRYRSTHAFPEPITGAQRVPEEVSKQMTKPK